MNTLYPQLSPDLLSQLVKAEDMMPPQGLKTGLATFDSFVLWQGLPKGEISVFEGARGLGATSFWLEAVRIVHSHKKWAAYVTDSVTLLPQHLQSKGIDLSRLLVVKKPQERDSFFNILQEMISSTLFETIACQICDANLAQHQLLKLKKLCRTYKVALVLLSSRSLQYQQHLTALYMQFKNNFITIKKAAHRLTPFTFEAGALYAHHLPQIFQKYR
ncbi:MAG: recA protein [Bdellovibrionia bacterium]